jgi:hypothetical protein
MLKKNDGYIDLKPGKYYRDEAIAVLHRPGKPPVELSIRAGEIDTIPLYIPLLQKYLLNGWDSQISSSTNKRLAGAAWGNRQYDLTPFRLLAPDGSVEEIPYPKQIFDYGITGFGHLLPMRPGIVINAAGAARGEAGLFLLQGERFIRFWGGPSVFDWYKVGPVELPASLRLSGRPSLLDWNKHGALGMVSSPDGCQLAFLDVKSGKYTTHNSLIIMNLCK